MSTGCQVHEYDVASLEVSPRPLWHVFLAAWIFICSSCVLVDVNASPGAWLLARPFVCSMVVASVVGLLAGAPQSPIGLAL